MQNQLALEDEELRKQLEEGRGQQIERIKEARQRRKMRAEGVEVEEVVVTRPELDPREKRKKRRNGGRLGRKIEARPKKERTGTSMSRLDDADRMEY